MRAQRHTATTIENTIQRSVQQYVQSVVDAVNDVISLRLLGGEAALVFLEDLLFLSGQSWDVEDLRDGVVRSVAGHLAGEVGVHAGHLEVHADVGVVDVDDLAAAQQADVFVIANGVGRQWGGGKGRGGRRCQKGAAVLGGQFCGGAGRRGLRHKGSDRTAVKKKAT